MTHLNDLLGLEFAPTGGPGDHGNPPFPTRLVPVDPNAPIAGPAGSPPCLDCGSKLWVWTTNPAKTDNARLCVKCGFIEWDETAAPVADDHITKQLSLAAGAVLARISDLNRTIDLGTVIGEGLTPLVESMIAEARRSGLDHDRP